MLEIIDDASRLRQIEPEWTALVQSLTGITPFQLPRWLLTWWPRFGSGRLHVMTFREGGELAGVIPCFLHEWDSRRQLTLIGSGISDYLEPAIPPRHCAEILNQLQTHLEANSDWDICNWQDLAATTPLCHLTSCATFDGNLCVDTPCTRVRLVSDFDKFWRERPSNLRRNVRRYRKKAEAEGPLDFEISGDADRGALDALINLHTARWRQEGEPGMIAANRSAGFLRDIARELAASDMFRLFSLRYCGTIAAVIFAISFRKAIYGYLTAFDPRYESFGLGRTLLFESIRYAHENGYEIWDFLRGDEPYKFWWGAEIIPKSRLILTRRS